MDTRTPQTVLLLGGTGRTGQRTLQQLLDRGLLVRAIVRSRGKLSAHVAGNPNLTVVEASLLSLNDEELRRHLHGCDAIISCLGHVISLKGILGVPRDLVCRRSRQTAVWRSHRPRSLCAIPPRNSDP